MRRMNEASAACAARRALVASASYAALEDAAIRFAGCVRKEAPAQPLLALVSSYRTASRLIEVFATRLEQSAAAAPLPGAEFAVMPDLVAACAAAPLATDADLMAAARQALADMQAGALLNASGIAAAAGATLDLIEAGFEPAVVRRLLPAARRAGGEFVLSVLENVVRGLERTGRVLADVQMLAGLVVPPERYSGLIVYGFYDLTIAQERLAAALLASFGNAGLPLGVFMPLAPDGREYAERALRFFERHIGLAATEVAGEHAAARLWQCVSARREAAYAVSEVRRALATGARPDEIIITARLLEPFLEPLILALERAGIEYRLSASLPLIRSGPGALLAEAIALFQAQAAPKPQAASPAPELPVQSFLGVLARPGSRWLPLVPLWRRLLAEANVVSYGELTAYLRRQASSENRVSGIERRESARLDSQVPNRVSSMFHATSLEPLEVLLRRLWEALAACSLGSPHGLVEFMHDTFAAGAPGLAEVRELLYRVSSVEYRASLQPSSYGRLDVLAALLAGGDYAPADSGRGVLVGDMMSVRNVPARLVVCLGARQGLLPQMRSEPPLTPYALREALNRAAAEAGVDVRLPTRRLHAAEERLLLSLLLHNASRLEFTYSAAAGGFAVPSSLLLEKGVPSAPAVHEPRESRGLPAALKRGGGAYLESLVSSDYMKHEGKLGAAAGKGRLKVSSSFFMDYLTCPYRAFLRHLLKLPEDIEATLEPLSALDWGIAVHGMIREALEKRLRGEALREALARGFEVLKRSGRVQRLPFYAAQVSRFAPLLAEWLDEVLPPVQAAVEAEREARFAAASVEFTARFDLLERQAAGARITDFKTGPPDNARQYYPQLFVYMHAVRRLLGLPWEALEARLCFLHRRLRKPVLKVYAPAAAEAAEEALSAAVAAIAGGLFLKMPQDDCRPCPYLRVCLVRGDRLKQRKGGSRAGQTIKAIWQVVYADDKSGRAAKGKRRARR